MYLLKGKAISFSLVCFLSVSIHGQPLIDSLTKQVAFAQIDTVKIQLYQRLAWELKYSEPLKATAYLDTALSIAKQGVPLKTLADVLYYKAIIFYLTDDYESALINCNTALKHYQETKYEYGQASIFNLQGLINNRIGDYETAIENYLESLALAMKGDNLYAISNPYHNIALIYKDINEYDKSLEYAKKAFEIRLELGDSAFVGQSYQTLGALYYHLTNYDTAEIYLTKALSLFDHSSDLNSLAISYLNLGLLNRDQGKLSAAEQLFDKAIAIFKDLEAHEDLVNALVNQSGVYLLQDDPKKANEYAVEAYNIASQYNLLPSLKEALEVKMDALEVSKSFEQAFYSSRELIAVSDSLLNEQKSNQISNLEIKFQVSQKEQQIELQRAQLAEQIIRNRNKTLIIAGLSIFLLLATIILFLIRSRSRKKEQLLKQEANLRLKEAQIEASINSQEKERARFAKDLHDGFGQLISVLNLNLKNLEEKNADRHQVFENSTEILDEMYREIKGICFNLMPQTLIQHGITLAIQEFAQRIEKASNISVYTDFFGMEDRLSEVQEVSLYRIIQEWINNTLKYANAKQITIQLTREKNAITLLIEDDGAGFERSLLENSSGNGWKNIQSRVNLIGGDVELDTLSGRRGNTFIVDFFASHSSLNSVENIPAVTTNT